MELFICKSIVFGECFSLPRWFWVKSNDQRPSPDVQRFRDEAPKELLEMQKKVVEHAIRMIVINSPIWVLVFMAVVIVKWLFGKMNKMALYSKVENYVEEHPEDHGVAIPAWSR